MKPWIMATALGASACTSPFSPYNTIESLRVLAVRATPPTPSPHDAVVLDALVVSPDHEPITYAWSWCPVLGNASAGYPCLLDEATLRALLEARVPGGGAMLPAYDLGSEATATLGLSMPAALLEALCLDLAAERGAARQVDCRLDFPLHVLLTTSTATEQVRSVKTLRFEYDVGTAANENPVLRALTLSTSDTAVAIDESAALHVAFGGEYALGIDVPETAAQSFTRADGTLARERLLVTWFVDSGETTKARTSYSEGVAPFADALQNTWTAPIAEVAPSKPSSLWVVVHDSRGGVAWAFGAVTLAVQP